MPTRKVKLCKEKPVLVSVYVERPRKRSASSTGGRQHHHHHHHHHHYVHHSIKQEVNAQKNDDAVGKGYSRRSQLLLYSQKLRESAAKPVESSSPLESKLMSSNQQQNITNNVAVKTKQKHSKSSRTCLGDWKVIFPGFCRSLPSSQAKIGKKKNNIAGSTSNAMKAAMKSLEIQKKRGFISKFLSTFQKRKV